MVTAHKTTFRVTIFITYRIKSLTLKKILHEFRFLPPYSNQMRRTVCGFIWRSRNSYFRAVKLVRGWALCPKTCVMPHAILCVCVLACVRACARACLHPCVPARARACIRVCEDGRARGRACVSATIFLRLFQGQIRRNWMCT